MGESNVGKTVFFGSYFHQVTDLGKGKYPVAIKSQSSDDKITEIITQLFDKKEVVAGTDVRVDFSFSVDSLGMDVELADLPGGFTTNRNYWDDEEVRKDLQNADGAFFFISAYDVENKPSEALKINRAFADAISEIRKHIQGNIKGRSDVPIWFIFTKGDTVPEVSAENLMSKVPSLLDAARKQQIKGNWLARIIYTKGRYVRAYKSQSMGKWINEQTLPVNFEPVNVVEPVEEMFEAMLESRGAHSKKFIWILSIGIVIIIAGAFGCSYWLDGVYWRSIENRVRRARESNNYSEAIKLLDEFDSPVTSIILPGFMRAGSNLKALRDETYGEYESELYAPIAAEIDKINENAFPAIDQAFLDTAKRVEKYLDTTHFAQINPEHYGKVKRSAWYFEAAKLFNIELSNTRADETENINPDEEFETILKCLNYEAPESWRDRIQTRVDESLRHWCRTSPREGSPDNLEPYIDRAQQLINHPNISEEISGYLSERIQAWQEEIKARWNKIAESWIAEANNLPPDNGIEILSSHLAEKITPEIRVMLEESRVSLYNKITNNALQEYAEDIDALKSVIAKYPSMPNADKEKISDRINFLWAQHIEDRSKSIRSAKTIGSLAKITSELGEEMNISEIKKAVNYTLSGLVDARLKEIDSEVGSMMRNDNFSDCKQYISNESLKLQHEIQGTVDNASSGTYTTKVKGKEQEILNSIQSAHVDYCKRSFNSRKNTRSERDITVCLNTMKDFIQTWPEALRTREGSEIRQVSEFLSAIQGGVRGRLHIVSGNFAGADAFTDTPDMKIRIVIGDESWTTNTIKDKIEPVFNQWIAITWSVEMSSVRFIGIEEDPMFDDTVFSDSVDPSGFKGYEDFNQTLRDRGNTLTIRFEPDKNIPSCPW